MKDWLARLRRAAESNDRAERTLGSAAVLSEALSAAGCCPVLVGGGAVEIYTRSAYTTHDLDFVAATTEQLTETMLVLGFEREGRHWSHAELRIVVEFPGAVLAPAEAVSISVKGSELRIISVEDLIVDRLASWKYWRWDGDGVAAVLLMASHPDLDGRRLARRADDEDVADALEVLQPLAGRTEPLTDEMLRRLRARLEG